MKYRAKPVLIEAWQWNGEDGTKWPKWLHDWTAPSGEVCSIYNGYLLVPTLEGRMQAKLTDWIIRGTHGELYPCSDEVFKTKYEPVEESK